MTNEIENTKENQEVANTSVSNDAPSKTTTTVDNKDTHATEPEVSTNIKTLTEQLAELQAKFAEKEKREKQKAQNDQVKKLEEQVLEMSKKLEEQADMASSTRVDGGSSISGTPMKTEINLNFRSSDTASWEKAAQQFLKNFQANQ